ncbi:MAG: hsp70 family protein, partial [Chloroflexota bacterium]|nr:hsp70 family protein [Chloroflexota bacterium]
ADSWQSQMQDGQIILVCDVGGGTTDFSLVGIRQGEQGLRFNRLAVGEHLLLGGDNMDLALGRHLETKLLGQPGKLDAGRWHQLVQQCRRAKETLLTAQATERTAEISVVGAGSSLIAGTLKGTLTSEEVHRLLLDGFFPMLDWNATADAPRRTGLTELGLPYVQDPAITRHLAAFWQRFQPLLQGETGRSVLYPDFLLFNGGALASAAIRQRLTAIVQQWFQPVAGTNWSPIELDNPHPHLAVAIGAAYYGLVRLGEGVRIGSGSPRVYYVGVAAGNRVSEQGFYSAVCLVPRGAEEGSELSLTQLDFTALTNQPVAFQLYSSSTRLGDQAGDVVQLPPDEVSVLPPIRTVLRYGKRGVAQPLPVNLAVRLTAIGTLELWCRAQMSEHEWRLEFDVRQAGEQAAANQALGETVDQALMTAALTEIARTFQPGAQRQDHAPEGVRKRLETLLDLPKEAWATGLLRPLADALLQVSAGRRLSAAHEVYWFNLLGFCLRPGFGDAGDELRMKEVWKLHFAGLHFATKPQNRAEWWVFWRRVAGGLKAGHQVQMYDGVRPALTTVVQQKKGGKSLASGEELEAWLALANFEWLPAATKTQLGRLLLAKFKKAPPRSQELWALGRFGARATLYGPLDRLIANVEAASWAESLLAYHLAQTDSLAHALVQLVRITGDRARDVAEEARQPVLDWLDALPHADRYRELLLNPASHLQREAQAQVFGEALPVGLVLAGMV